MDWPRYEFSKECEPELAEFFKATTKEEESQLRSDKKVWEMVLPMNEKLRLKFKTSVVNEIIDLTEDDEMREKCEILERPQVESDLLLPNQVFSLMLDKSKLHLTADDLIDGVPEMLELESVLPDDVIKSFGKFPEDFEKIFTTFANNLNLENTFKLWKSINMSTCTERTVIATNFIKYTLMMKMSNKHSKDLQELLSEVLIAFPEEVVKVVSKTLFDIRSNTELSLFKNNLDAISDNHKNDILIDFIIRCIKLEESHLTFLPILITSCADKQNLSKLVDLMSNTVKQFVFNKSYGKLLKEIVQILGCNVIDCEQQLKFILSIHKSIFKVQVTQLFESFSKDRKTFSESFRI